MMAYSDYLAARGYRRTIIERTDKRPGDLVLERTGSVRVPGQPAKVTPIRKVRGS